MKGEEISQRHPRWLLEVVAGLELAPVILGLILLFPDVAISPAQRGIGSQRGNNLRSIQFGFEARSLSPRGKGKIHRPAEEYRIGPTDYVADRGAKYLGLKQKCGHVRPV